MTDILYLRYNQNRSIISYDMKVSKITLRITLFTFDNWRISICITLREDIEKFDLIIVKRTYRIFAYSHTLSIKIYYESNRMGFEKYCTRWEEEITTTTTTKTKEKRKKKIMEKVGFERMIAFHYCLLEYVRGLLEKNRDS